MRDFLNEPIFAVVVGGILVVCTLIYGIDCLRWANEMERRCRRVQKQINKRRAKR